MLSYGDAVLRMQEQPRDEKTGFTGLCSTCDHDAACAFRRSPNQPVMFCEDFSAQEVPVATLTASKHSSGTTAKTVPLYTGLCVNCAEADTCVFPSKGAGGWYCEEHS